MRVLSSSLSLSWLAQLSPFIPFISLQFSLLLQRDMFSPMISLDFLLKDYWLSKYWYWLETQFLFVQFKERSSFKTSQLFNLVSFSIFYIIRFDIFRYHLCPTSTFLFENHQYFRTSNQFVHVNIQIEVQIYRDINSLWSITAPFPFPFSTMRAWPNCQYLCAWI